MWDVGYNKVNAIYLSRIKKGTRLFSLGSGKPLKFLQVDHTPMPHERIRRFKKCTKARTVYFRTITVFEERSFQDDESCFRKAFPAARGVFLLKLQVPFRAAFLCAQ